jgi:hypothetical protein
VTFANVSCHNCASVNVVPSFVTSTVDVSADSVLLNDDIGGDLSGHVNELFALPVISQEMEVVPSDAL